MLSRSPFFTNFKAGAVVWLTIGILSLCNLHRIEFGSYEFNLFQFMAFSFLSIFGIVGMILCYFYDSIFLKDYDSYL